MPQYVDSLKKINSYLDALSQDKVILSALFFRDYVCNMKCGACCPKFSLDYFEGERWEKFKEKYPEKAKDFVRREVNGVVVYTDWQKDNNSHFCKNLNLEDGTCSIHGNAPFSCEFELIRFINQKTLNKSLLLVKQFGRGWNMLRVDGHRGTLCEITKSITFERLVEHINLLKELQKISTEWKRDTRLTEILEYLESNLESFKRGEYPKSNIEFSNKENNTKL